MNRWLVLHFYKCVQYTYTGSRNHLHFLWHINRPDASENETLQQSMKVRDELKKSFPVYHSRAMRREFIHSFGTVTHSNPAFLREAYRRLTGDSSASSNATETEVDARIAHLLDTEDPDLVWDLRVNNSGRPETYTTYLEFWPKLQTKPLNRRNRSSFRTQFGNLFMQVFDTHCCC